MKKALSIIGIVGALFIVMHSFVFAETNRTLTVNLEWTSGSQRVDLDLYIKNPNGEICNYSHRNTNWGATHERDDRGTSNGYSYESFTVDLNAMDCYGSGYYKFYINHYSGPTITSTFTTSWGHSWDFTTSRGDDKYVVYYNADQSQCEDQSKLLSAISLAQTTNIGKNFIAYIEYLQSINKIITYDASLNSGGSAHGFITKFETGWDGGEEYIYCDWGDARIEVNERHSIEYMASAIIHEVSHYKDLVDTSNNGTVHLNIGDTELLAHANQYLFFKQANLLNKEVYKNLSSTRRNAMKKCYNYIYNNGSKSDAESALVKKGYSYAKQSIDLRLICVGNF